MSNPGQIKLFDRALIRAHRDRAAAGFAAHNALFDETACQLIERLADIKQEFKAVLDLGAHDGSLARHFTKRGVPLVVAADISEKMLQKMQEAPPAKTKDLLSQVQVFASSPQAGRSAPLVVADEEFLPFAPASFDLIISNLSLHWTNDLPGALVQIKNALKPGGLFIAAFIGGGSLFELRSCLMEAEISVTGGASPRLAPTIDMQTASALLQRAGFELPVTDQEKVTLAYTDTFALMRDLRGMGETNTHLERLRHPTRRRIFTEADRLYRERFADTHGALLANFEVIFWHGMGVQG